MPHFFIVVSIPNQSNQTMTKTPPPPTISALAKALSVSPRRVSQLILDGMPRETIEGAIAWRGAKQVTDSAEQLRRKRIEVAEQQRVKLELENRVRRGELLPAGEVESSAIQVCSASRAALLSLTNTLPPRLAGLTESKILTILRTEFFKILRDLSDGRFFDCPEVHAIIEAAKLEAKAK